MIFTRTSLEGMYIVEVDPRQDERGFFARTWCRQEFQEQGLDANLAQCSISFNKKKGTLRGMHIQLPPFAEAKLVRCTQGALYDVVVDLRREAESYLQWTAVTLTAENHKALYVPQGCAHGFQTLADNTEALYQISEFYAPEYARGFRWNDPAFQIEWPLEITVISAKDQEYPDYTLAEFTPLSNKPLS